MPYRQGATGFEIVYNYQGVETNPPVKNSYNMLLMNSFILSSGHSKKYLGKFNTGGAFQLTKHTISRQKLVLPLAKIGSSPYGFWSGGIFTGSDAQVGNVTAASASVISSMENDSRKVATSTVSQVNPMKPYSDVLTPALELYREGGPHLVGAATWKERSSYARSAGSEYLNVEFGWAPLVREVQAFASTVVRTNELIRSFEQQAGKRLRRRMGVSSTSFVSPPIKVAPVYTYPVDINIFGPGEKTIYITQSDRVWFAGAFKYYLPESGLGRYTTLATKLFGAKLTPKLLWELTPWSWAVDWHTNVGDILENVSFLGSDATVMEWGYMMNERIITRTHTGTYPAAAGGQGAYPALRSGGVQLMTTERTSYKTRIPANYYSFSATPAPLTAKQGAIIAALGLTRIR